MGLAGLIGAGRTEVARTIIGDRTEGWLRSVARREVHFKSAIEAVRSGVAYVTEDRRRDGTFLSMSIYDNVSLQPILLQPPWDPCGVLAWRRGRGLGLGGWERGVQGTSGSLCANYRGGTSRR